MNPLHRPAHPRARSAAWFGLLGIFIATVANAGLGEDATSIERDHLVLRGESHGVTETNLYQRHEIVTSTGTRVREYLSAAGMVFAVTWSGPALPDLKTLLAAHYPEFVAAADSRSRNHHVFSLNTPGLVLQNLRLPRGFAGFAFVPSMMPVGTSAADLN